MATGSRSRRKTPSILQIEAVECGAASLGMILGHYGRWVTLEELRHECGISRDGSKASNIVKAARHYGLEARGRMSPLDDMLKLPVPSVIMWNNNHFVVFEGTSGNTFYINDPASGPRKMGREEFKKSYSRIVLVFKRTKEFRRGGRRPSLFPALSRRLKGSWSGIGLVFLVSLLMVVPGIAMAGLLKAFIDEVLIKSETGWLFPLAIGLTLAALLNGLLSYLQQRWLQRVELKLIIAMTAQLFWHILKLPPLFFTQRYTGDIIARLRSAQEIARLLSGRLSTSFVDIVLVVLYGAAMFMLNAQLAILLFVLTAVNAVVVIMANRVRADLNGQQTRVNARLISAGMGGLQAIETIKATGTEHDFFSRWSGHHANLINTRQRLGFLNSAIDAVPGVVSQLMSAALLGFGGWLVIQGDMTIGDIVGFQILLARFTTPGQSIVTLSAELQVVGANMNMVDDALEYKADPVFERSKAPVKSSGRLRGAIEIEDVSFAYGPLDPPVIKNVSLSVQPGMRVAFVGPSGSGKSTLTRLLLGLYQPSSGNILFDGYPREDIAREVLNDSITNVDQDIMLFEGTIRDNLTLWDETIPDNVIRQAAMDADIHDVIAARPGGYNSAVEEGGTNFSGGQRQRLEIARALVRDPAVLFLDEATAALDTVTEKTIDDNLRRRGCTCVIVAHRLSTIRDADMIVVLAQGEVVESGTYEELIDMDGTFAQLVKDA